jgi:hypothetical protein
MLHHRSVPGAVSVLATGTVVVVEVFRHISDDRVKVFVVHELIEVLDDEAAIALLIGRVSIWLAGHGSPLQRLQKASVTMIRSSFTFRSCTIRCTMSPPQAA